MDSALHPHLARLLEDLFQQHRTVRSRRALARAVADQSVQLRVKRRPEAGGLTATSPSRRNKAIPSPPWCRAEGGHPVIPAL
jgi:hypothetical protein